MEIDSLDPLPLLVFISNGVIGSGRQRPNIDARINYKELAESYDAAEPHIENVPPRQKS